MALFITFEGGEGSGKSLQARALYKKLSQLAIPAILTHEPGGTPFGERIARWLKWSEKTAISPLTELMLFNASRTKLVEEVILPALTTGQVVICDRYTDSTMAYQGYGRQLDMKLVEMANNIATQGLKPNLTILLDIAPEKGFMRKFGDIRDNFEKAEMEFHQRVRRGYLELAAQEPERWLVIDASQPKEKIAQIIWQKARQLLLS